MKTPIILVLLTSIASAQAPDASSAEALFREGRKLMTDKKLAEACEKFEASERLDDNVGTLLNLADCREKNGQLASAWATFLKAASTARTKHDDHEASAKRHAAALEPRLAYLTISVPEASKVDGLVIKRDDTVIDTALWNTGVPVDAGRYKISGEAPGHEAWSTVVDIREERQHASVEVPRFKPLREMSKVVVPEPKGPAPQQPVAEETEDRPPPSRFTTLRKVSIASAVVGVGGIGAGVYFGLTAKDLAKQSDAICPGRVCGDAHALDLNHTAQRDALTSEILFGVGGAAVAGAVVMWVVGAPSSHATLVPTGNDHEAGVSLVGEW